MTPHPDQTEPQRSRQSRMRAPARNSLPLGEHQAPSARRTQLIKLDLGHTMLRLFHAKFVSPPMSAQGHESVELVTEKAGGKVVSDGRLAIKNLCG